MAVNHQYLYDDIVCRTNKSGNIEFGKVVETSELLSYESSDEENAYTLKRGNIRVVWHTTGTEEVIREKKVVLVDRVMSAGDVVKRKTAGMDSQHGYCRDIQVTACVNIKGTNKVVNGVASEKLVPLKEFATGLPVFLDSWVGGIKRVNARMTLRTMDGSRCVIKPRHFVSDFDLQYYDGFDRSGYFPGQTIWGPPSGLDRATWLNCSKRLMNIIGNKHKFSEHIKVTIEGVEVESVEVRWRCQAFSKDAGDKKDHPDKILSGEALKALKLLNVLEPCSLRLGDINYYSLAEADMVITKGKWRQAQKDLYALNCDSERRATEKSGGVSLERISNSHCLKKIDPIAHDEDIDSAKSIKSEDIQNGNHPDRKGKKGNSVAPAKTRCLPTLKISSLNERKLLRAREKRPPVEPGARAAVVVETVSTSSRTTVVWQDGTVEPGVPTTELCPVTWGDREFFPGDFVLESRADGTQGVYGVVQSADRVGRTVVVQWFRAYTSSDPLPEVLGREELSIYDIKSHPDFHHRQGVVVIKVANFDGEEGRCWVGQVLDNSPEGKVSVRWVDGRTTECWPQDLVGVRTCGRCILSDVDDEDPWDDTSSEASWETEGSLSQSSSDEELSSLKELRPIKSMEKELNEALPDRDKELQPISNAPFSAMVDLCSFIMGQMARAWTQVRFLFEINSPRIITPSHATDTVLRTNTETKDSQGETERVTTSTTVQAAIPSAEDFLAEPPTSESVKESHGEFSMMETVPDSHHFKTTKFQPTNPKLFFKTVRNEIKLLRTSLPGGIWVKGFEDRMDLFSAMIRGPANTPYEEGLFLFDFQLSPDYPKSPPTCHYISFRDERLNPNLYVEGKVCVSLLGTWSGKGTEVWTESSNLLQVIVSVQGLILVSEPYFNEPGYERERGTPEGWERSQGYNETVVLNMVQGLSEMILRPPAVFEQEIVEHFAENADRLCKRLEGWLEASEKPSRNRPESPATPISPEDQDRNATRIPEFPLIPASKGFCLTLRKALKTFREVLLSVCITPC